MDPTIPQSPAAQPIPDLAPAPTGYKLPASTVRDWMTSDKVSPLQVHSAAMAVDSDYKAGVQRLNDHAKANNQPYGDDPNFVSRALYTYYKAGTKPVGNKTTTSLLQALHDQNTPKPPAPQPVTPDAAPTPPVPGILDTAKDMATGAAQGFDQAQRDIGQAIPGALGQVQDIRGPALKQAGIEGLNNNDPASAALSLGGAAAGAVVNPIAGAMHPIVASFGQLVGQLADKAHGPAATAMKQNIQNGMSSLNTYVQQHPETAGLIGNVTKILSVIPALQGTASTIEGVGSGLGDLGKGVMDTGFQLKATRDAAAVVKDSQAMQKSVMPPTTKQVFQDTNANLKNEGSFFKDPSVNATDRQKDLSNIAETLKEKGWSPSNSAIKNEKVAQGAWNNESEDLLREMKAKGGALSHQEFLSNIRTRLEKEGYPTDSGVGKKVMSLWEDSGKSLNGKIDGGWQTKIDFSKEATRKWGNSIYQKGTDLADAVNASHEAANEVVSRGAKLAGVDYSGQMDRLSGIHKIIENTKLQQAGGALKSGLKNTLKNPVVKYALPVAGATEALHIAHLIP